MTGHTAFMMPATPVAGITGAVTIALEPTLLTMLAHRAERRAGPRE